LERENGHRSKLRAVGMTAGKASAKSLSIKSLTSQHDAVT
jgi:hypothetical protein